MKEKEVLKSTWWLIQNAKSVATRAAREASKERDEDVEWLAVFEAEGVRELVPLRNYGHMT